MPHRARRRHADDEAALVKAVVLNGAGGLRVLRLRLDRLHDARALGARERGLGLGLLPELVDLVVSRELAVGCSKAANTSQ